MSYTTDPEDPKLGHGIDKDRVPLNDVYLVLSEEERAKGFIRPLRHSYIHVGLNGYEIDPYDMSKSGLTGNACGAETRMGLPLAETYARDPNFYGSTYCVGCKKHLAVEEFKWAEDNEVVGS